MIHPFYGRTIRVRFWGRTRNGYVVRDMERVGYRQLGVVFRDADIPQGLREPRVNWYRSDEVTDE